MWSLNSLDIGLQFSTFERLVATIQEGQSLVHCNHIVNNQFSGHISMFEEDIQLKFDVTVWLF
jgi:hypothetical protein